jgi:putative spermidine/putrescine transport system substrate-binding protein
MPFFGRSAAIAAMITAGALVVTASHSQEIVVATFGGSFAEDTKTCHIAPFEEGTGAKAALKLGSSVQHAAAIRAMGGKSDFDVAYLDDALSTQIKNEGLLAKIDRSRLRSAPDVAAKVWDNALVTRGRSRLAHGVRVLQIGLRRQPACPV